MAAITAVQPVRPPTSKRTFTAAALCRSRVARWSAEVVRSSSTTAWRRSTRRTGPSSLPPHAFVSPPIALAVLLQVRRGDNPRMEAREVSTPSRSTIVPFPPLQDDAGRAPTSRQGASRSAESGRSQRHASRHSFPAFLDRRIHRRTVVAKGTQFHSGSRMMLRCLPYPLEKPLRHVE